jgi:hypothetical protein
VPNDISFVWPAAGIMQIISLPGGGFNVKFTFAERTIVRSIGKGWILKVQNITTKRIAQQYEILIRHEGEFESSYSIVDQDPKLPAGETHHLRIQGTFVDDGAQLYDISNGGCLHFQLFQAGNPVDPRKYIREEFVGTTDATNNRLEHDA